VKHCMLAMLLCLCVACAPKIRAPLVPTESSVAVAHFVQPQHDWELMAGVLPEQKPVIPAESLDVLDQALQAALEKKSGRPILHSDMVRQCEEIVLASKSRNKFETVEYWKSVGSCMQADFLLVPFVTRWQERQGGEWGVTTPAAVTLDIYLIETATGQVRRYHFEEEQRGLAENLLQGKRFFKRKGKWVTPLEIAVDAVGEGVAELGL